MLNLILLAIAIQAFVAWHLWSRLCAWRQQAIILRQLLDSEMDRNTDLINTNYMLACLNEDLFVTLDQRNPLITPLRAPVLN